MSAVNPIVTFVMCLVWFATATLLLDPVFQAAVIVLVAGFLLVTRRIRPVVLAAISVPLVLFGLGFVVTHMLFRADGGVVATSSAAVFDSGTVGAAVTLGLRAVACGMISVFFAFTSDAGGFVRALVARARLPQSVGYALFAALQTVPALAVEAQQQRMSRAMRRGRPLTRIPRPAETVALVVPLLAFAIRRASRTALAMEARGFTAAGHRTMVNVPGFGRADAVFAVLAFGLLGLLIARPLPPVVF